MRLPPVSGVGQRRDDVADSLAHAAGILSATVHSHGMLLARNRAPGIPLLGGRGAGIVDEALVDQCDGWFVVLFSENRVVQTVLGARPSIADGNNDRVHLLSSQRA